MHLKYLKISEIAKISKTSPYTVSRFFNKYPENYLLKKNRRIIGISPDAVEKYFLEHNLNFFYKPSIILSANLCGGVGKTSTIFNMGCFMRKILKLSTPILFIDCDSQASLTSLVTGEPAHDDQPTLIDYLERKVPLNSILSECGNNTWIIKSNLNLSWADRTLSKPNLLKNSFLHMYSDIYNVLGKDTIIFQDHTPQLSTLFASSVCALHQLKEKILKVILIPLRSDKFAIQGGDYIIKELDEIKETFSFADNIDTHCFFSSIDNRISTTANASKLARAKDTILKHLAPVVIRYCAEIPKSSMSNEDVFSKGTFNNAAQDYSNLLQYIYSYR